MALYEQESKKTANSSSNVKLFPNEDDTFTLGWLQQRWLEMDGARDDSLWERRMEQEDATISWNDDGTANVNLPIERSQARLKEADETAQKPLIKFVPTEPDDVDKVEVTEELFDFAWKQANTDEELAKSRQCKRIIGTHVWKEFIKTKRITKWTLDKQPKDGKLKGSQKTVTRSWIQGKMVDIRNMWFDPVHDQDDIVDCFEAEVDISKAQLEALKKDPNYKNIDKALEAQPLSDDLRSRPFFVKEENKRSVDLQNPKYSIFNYFNSDKGVWIQSVDFNVIIRESVNPDPTGGIPYIIGVDEPKYMSLYGRGMHEQLETVKYELNVITNQLIDLVRESSTNTLILPSDASIDDNQIVNGIGRVMNIDGENFQWSTPPQSDKGLGGVRDVFQQDATMITGIDAYSVQGDTARTLGQEEIREVNRLKSLSVTINAWNYFLVRMAKKRLAYIQFYMPITTGKKIIGDQKVKKIPIRNKKIKKVMGFDPKTDQEIEKGITFKEEDGFTDFLEITPDMIMSNLDVEIESPVTSTTLKQIKKQRVQEVIDTAISAAQINPEIAQKLAKFTEEGLKISMEEAGHNPERFFDSQEGAENKKQKEIRGNVLGDVPLPPKVAQQPQRNNRDQLANVAGLNLPGQTAEETV